MRSSTFHAPPGVRDAPEGRQRLRVPVRIGQPLVRGDDVVDRRYLPVLELDIGAQLVRPDLRIAFGVHLTASRIERLRLPPADEVLAGDSADDDLRGY